MAEEETKKELVTASLNRQTSQNNTTTQSFSDLLVSGGEIEGMFQQKRKQDKDRKTSKKSITNGLKDPVTVLKERLDIYNNKREQKYHLILNEEELSYYGLLTFQYHNGYQLFQEDFEVKNMMTASRLIPSLLSRFLPQYELSATQTEASSSYIVLSQEGIERELDQAEKPLEVALDCSLKGLSFPSFTLKTSISLLQLPNTPQHLRKKLSSLSLTHSSLSSLGHGSSEGSESPRIIETKTIADNESVYSFNSSAPSYSSFTHPPRTSSSGNRSLFKSQTNKHKFLEHKHSDMSLGSPVSTPTTFTPDKRTKSKVGNFMEGVARSLKSKRKPRPTSIYPEETIALRNPQKLSQESIVGTNERRFSMPTVFHIHYSNAKNAQLYKSVLVSENSTTLEVIKQALERYSMKFADPKEFSLYEVIGRWEAMMMDSMESGLEQSLGALVTPLSPGNSQESKTISMPAFEEFVVYYTRELGHEEQPYDVQFFHQAPEGYTRRFELRSKVDDDFDNNSKKDSCQDVPVPSTPLFGVTSHSSRRTNDNEEEVTFNLSSPSIKSVGKNDETPLIETTLVAQSFLDCSSPDGEIDDHHKTDAFYSTAINSPYLLNLQLNCNNVGESFVYQLPLIGNDKVALIANNSFITSFQDHYQIKVSVPEDEGPVLCRFYTENTKYNVEPHNAIVMINGSKVISPLELAHGDLIQIGRSHLFMFQDFHKRYTSLPTDSNTSWPYRWYPTKTTGTSTQAAITTNEGRESSPSINQTEVVRITEHTAESPTAIIPLIISSNNNNNSSTSLSSERSNSRSKLPTVKEIEDDDESRDNLKPIERRRGYSDSRIRKLSPSSSFNQKTLQQSTSFFIRQQRTKVLTVTDLPVNHTILYSHVTATCSKLDNLFDILIKEIDPKSVSFPLAPAYILAMCLDYCLKSDGNKGACVFVRKAVDVLQQIVMDITNQLSSWQPNPTSNCSPLTTINHLLYSVLFWFSNCLEIYNYLVNCSTLKLNTPNEKEDENPLTLLENIILNLFKQVFYPISKTLYSILPLMFEEILYKELNETSDCVMQSIECLKEILEMMLELHVHTEMIAHFFTNIFFFLNNVMFNTFIDQGSDMGLFQYYRGAKLRASLEKLEGWAGRVGFRDIIYQFFGTFLTAIDLIAVPPQELLTLSWKTLREEFPCLHPTQLNFILSHYILPKEFQGFVTQWTPTSDDSLQANNKDMLHETFDSNPSFYLPIGGYSLDLTSCQDDHLLLEFIDFVESELDKKTVSSQDKRVDKNQKLSRPSLKVTPAGTETKDIKTKEHPQRRSKKSKGRQKHQKQTTHNDNTTDGPAELRGRVKSIVEPQLIKLPEKLVILSQEEEEEEEETGDSSEEILESSGQFGGVFPKGSRAVSLQRGHKGFGFHLEERKDSEGLYLKLDETELLLEENSDLQNGDRVLAVDDLYVSQTDYTTIQKYIKEAEEEISIVLAPTDN